VTVLQQRRYREELSPKKVFGRNSEWTIHRHPSIIALSMACSFRGAARAQPVLVQVRPQLALKFSIRAVPASANITLPTARSQRCPQIQKEEP
jgi:hypothetical protein